MSETFIIANARLVCPGDRIEPGALLVEQGRIAGWHTNADSLRSACAPLVPPILDGQGSLLTPGLIDVHTHGIGLALYEKGEAALRAADGILGSFGVTTVMPTLVPRADAAGLDAIAQASGALAAAQDVDMPGLHLEGPFVALGGAACATVAGDLGLLEELLFAAQGRTRIMSISPDTPKIIPVIERLREHGIKPFITHTRASVDQTVAAIDAGATHATHFYDVFPLPPETDPGVRPAGVVEVMLADRRTTVDFIADGVHVHPMAIRAAVAAKGWGGVLLITDSNIGAGLPPGVHETPWGYPVRVRPGDGARHAEKGFLAGSALTMNTGMANLLRWLDLPTACTWAMGTLNPARLLGLADRGHLQNGARADLVLWDDDLQPRRTWLAGRCVYERLAAESP